MFLNQLSYKDCNLRAKAQLQEQKESSGSKSHRKQGGFDMFRTYFTLSRTLLGHHRGQDCPELGASQQRALC